MNEQSLGLQKLSSISPAESSDIINANASLDANLITKMSDNNNNIKNTKLQTSDTEEMDTDDTSSPFTKSNHNDLINLAPTNNDDIKTINRRSHSKSLFKSIFCCFSTSLHRNHAKSSNKTKKSSFINSNNFNNACNASTVSPSITNNNTTTTTTTTTTPSTTTNNVVSNLSNSNSSTPSGNNNDNITPNSNNANFKDSNSTDNNSQSNKYNGINSTTTTSSSNSNVNNGNNLNNDKLNSNLNNNNNYIDNSNGFQLNYNYTLSYPSYRDYQHERFLLPPVNPIDSGKKCLIIDLDETLVHSSFKQVSNADFIVPVEIDGVIHQVYVLKRPYVDEFLKKMGQLYECVLFTASLAKYADPVADLLDRWGVFRYRLFREACVYYRGNYVKDLSRLGRDLNKVIILDNSPASYIFHPNNAVPCISWFDDMNDTELNDLIPHFERLSVVDSVYTILKQSNTNSINSQSNQFSNQFQSHHHHQQQQPVVFASNYANSTQMASNCDDDSNQQVPITQTQSIIYQAQQSSTTKSTSLNSLLTSTKSNEDNSSSIDDSNNNNFNYELNENKVILSIDLMMATKQQQQQQLKQGQENEKNQS